uniref:F-box domain-containing protein n=1 Tax=Setaria viridis TaxID=4556 RepID=A0A4U6TQN6_SETVI|nr:hypothetical protein SEVIR_8G072300v2 [Setaria viridis]
MARRSRAKRAPRPGGQDLISTLPDGVLQHVFGFLPADEAVRTSVLAPRWLRLWRSMGRLRIVSAGRWRSVDDFNEFVDRLLLRREPNLSLTKLELSNVLLNGNFLDFSSCPALEDITITNSQLSTQKILSKSVKRLTIRQCYINFSTRMHISVPNIVWLHLHCFECCGVCTRCRGNDEYSDRCLLLEGLSSATNLELIAQRGMVIFHRDLRWCPTFSKLKTLLLNEWCVAIDVHALVSILKHSPVLEKLILQLIKGPETLIELEGIYDPTELEETNVPTEQLPAISEHLNVIEIRCGKVNWRICKVLRFMSSFG